MQRAGRRQHDGGGEQQYCRVCAETRPCVIIIREHDPRISNRGRTRDPQQRVDFWSVHRNIQQHCDLMKPAAQAVDLHAWALTAGSCSARRDVREALPRLPCFVTAAPLGATNSEEGWRPRPNAQARRVTHCIFFAYAVTLNCRPPGFSGPRKHLCGGGARCIWNRRQQ